MLFFWPLTIFEYKKNQIPNTLIVVKFLTYSYILYRALRLKRVSILDTYKMCRTIQYARFHFASVYLRQSLFFLQMQNTLNYASDKRFTCGMQKYYWIDITWLRLIIRFNIFLLKKKSIRFGNQAKVIHFCGMLQFLCNYHQLKKTKTKKNAGHQQLHGQ